MPTKELVADLQEVFAKHNVESAVFAIPREPGEFFLIMHYVSVEDVQALGILLTNLHTPVEPRTLH